MALAVERTSAIVEQALHHAGLRAAEHIGDVSRLVLDARAQERVHVVQREHNLELVEGDRDRMACARSGALGSVEQRLKDLRGVDAGAQLRSQARAADGQRDAGGCEVVAHGPQR